MKRLTTLLFSYLMLTAVALLPRGIVMIDVSRHFMPIDFLYRQVDELSRYGIPAMPLHLTDAADWRLVAFKPSPTVRMVGYLLTKSSSVSLYMLCIHSWTKTSSC